MQDHIHLAFCVFSVFRDSNLSAHSAFFAAKQLYLSPHYSTRAQPEAISGTYHMASSDGSRQRPALTLSPWSDVK